MYKTKNTSSNNSNVFEDTKNDDWAGCDRYDNSHSFFMPGKDKKLDKITDLPRSVISALNFDIARITEIRLSGHSYGVEVCKFLGDILKDSEKLKYVDFSNCFVGKNRNQVRDCLEALLFNLTEKGIFSLDVSDNALSPSSAPAFVPFILTNPELKELNLNN